MFEDVAGGKVANSERIMRSDGALIGIGDENQDAPRLQVALYFAAEEGKVI